LAASADEGPAAGTIFLAGTGFFSFFDFQPYRQLRFATRYALAGFKAKSL